MTSIPTAKLHSAHAVTVYALPSGSGRDWPRWARGTVPATYSYDLFERRTGRNLYRVDPSIPPLAAGSAMPFYPGAPMIAAVAEPPHALVLWQATSEGKTIERLGFEFLAARHNRSLRCRRPRPPPSAGQSGTTIWSSPGSAAG